MDINTAPAPRDLHDLARKLRATYAYSVGVVNPAGTFPEMITAYAPDRDALERLLYAADDLDASVVVTRAASVYEIRPN
jgi:hypothetical protein